MYAQYFYSHWRNYIFKRFYIKLSNVSNENSSAFNCSLISVEILLPIINTPQQFVCLIVSLLYLLHHYICTFFKQIHSQALWTDAFAVDCVTSLFSWKCVYKTLNKFHSTTWKYEMFLKWKIRNVRIYIIDIT